MEHIHNWYGFDCWCNGIYLSVFDIWKNVIYNTFLKNVIYNILEKCVIHTEMLFVLSKYQAYFRQIRKIGKNMTCSDFCREFKNPIFNPQKLKNKNRS